MHPLSHHEILGLVEPFTRRGQRVDLAASDRAARRLMFKPVDHAGEPPLRETLTLDNPEPGRWRLTRGVMVAGGAAEATLQAEGAEPAEVFARIDAIAPRRQCHVGAGHVIAWHHQLPSQAAGQASQRPDDALLLSGATVSLDGYTLALKLPRVSGIPAEVQLTPLAGDNSAALPEDLLAVLGLPWSRLARAKAGWQASLRLRGDALRRSRAAEARLVEAADHLARTLAEAPRRFHERFAGARWAVVLRRAVPLLVCLGLVAAAAAVPLLNLSQDSPLRMLIFNAPPLLLVLFFSLQEMPRIEVPPWPRPSTAPAWRLPTPVAAAAADPHLRAPR